MGYDIVTRNADKARAEQFAKQYGYSYLFNKDTGAYEGDSTPYFRANIWGMGTIRRIFVDLYTNSNKRNMVADSKFSEIINKFSWNDGAHVTTSDCEFLISLWDKDRASDFAIMEVYEAIKEDPDYLRTKRPIGNGEWEDYTATVEEAVNGKINLAAEFVDYLGIAKELDGCLVW